MEHKNRNLLYMVYQNQCKDGENYCMIYFRFKISVSYAAVHHMVGQGSRCDIMASTCPIKSRLRCMDGTCPSKYVEIGTYDVSVKRTENRTAKQPVDLSSCFNKKDM